MDVVFVHQFEDIDEFLASLEAIARSSEFPAEALEAD